MLKRSSFWARTPLPHRTGRGAGRRAVLALALVLCAGAGGCDWVPDEINPARLFRDDEAKASAPKNSDGEFPNLSTVPDAPRPASSPEELRQATEGLVADREKAAYTDEFLKNHPGEEVDFSTATKAAPAEVRRPISADSSSDVAAAEADAARAAEQAAKAADTATPPAPAPEPAAETVVEAPPPPALSGEVTPEATTVAAAPAPSVEVQEANATEPPTQSVDDLKSELKVGQAGNPAEVVFEASSTSLDDKANHTLSDFAKLVAERRGTVRILTWAGAADTDDGATLAERRAVAVAEKLLELGVSGQRLSALVMKGPDPEGGALTPPSGRASITLKD